MQSQTNTLHNMINRINNRFEVIKVHHLYIVKYIPEGSKLPQTVFSGNFSQVSSFIQGYAYAKLGIT